MSKKVFLSVAIIIFLAGFIFSASRTEAEINVYDNDGQYLGILERAGYGESAGRHYYIKIFSPSTGRFYTLRNSLDTPESCDLWVAPQYYETTDCTGPSYMSFYPLPTYPIVDKTCTGSYVSLGEPKVITVRSYKYAPDCECKAYHEPTDAASFEWVPASAPPFTLPVALPFRYEHSILGAEKIVIGPP